MNELIIDGKKVKALSIGGKNVKSFEIGGKVFTFIINSFTGSFNTPQLEKDFLATTTSVPARKFELNSLTFINMQKVTTIGKYAFNSDSLTSFNIPNATTIGGYAFYNNLLTSINIPNATTIGGYAFWENRNITTATMQSKFNTTAEKDRIFGSGQWQNITFTWV